jgi:hypothetical protein
MRDPHAQRLRHAIAPTTLAAVLAVWLNYGSTGLQDLVDVSVSSAAHAARVRGWGSWRVIFSITLASLARVKVHSNGRAIVR